MTTSEPLIAGVELGGTKCIAVTARGREIVSRAQWPTGDDASATLATLAEWLSAAHQFEPFSALGIASFGPLCLDPASANFGHIVNTPKPGWSGADVLGVLAGDLGVPVAIDTDVAGAALAEGRWGASQSCPVHVYITIGTGIGGGIVVDGKPLHGTFHPEMGHVRVRRAPGDPFMGVCLIHGDCLEGLAAGPAIAARTGKPANVLASDDPVWAVIANEIGDFVASLILTLAPHRIVIGGGVGQGQPALLPLIHAATARVLGGYLPGHSLAALQSLIVHPGLGGDAGVCGAMALALAALDG
jgi:fructokinase